ncbi:MAG: hypothetical protein ACREUG_17015 [Steroidobacteraceae bacterium]
MTILKVMLLVLIAQLIAEELHVDRTWSIYIGWLFCAISMEMDRNRTWRAVPTGAAS